MSLQQGIPGTGRLMPQGMEARVVVNVLTKRLAWAHCHRKAGGETRAAISSSASRRTARAFMPQTLMLLIIPGLPPLYYRKIAGTP